MKKFLFLALLIAGSLSASDRGAIRGQVRDRIGDTYADNWYPKYTDSELNDKINIAQDVIAAQGRFLIGTYSTRTYTSQREYSLPADCITLEKVSFWITPSTKSFSRLEYKSIDNLDSTNSNWQGRSDAKPLYYYQQGKKIGLSPACSATYSTSSISLVFEYVKSATALTVDSDIPFDGYPHLVPYHSIITKGVVDLCSGGFSGDFFTLIDKMVIELSKNPDMYWNKQLYERQQ